MEYQFETEETWLMTAAGPGQPREAEDDELEEASYAEELDDEELDQDDDDELESELDEEEEL